MLKFTPVVLLALVACATTQSMQSKEPDMTLVSEHPSAQLEECLALKLSWLSTPSIIHGEHETIMAFGQPTPGLSVTIRDSGASRTIDLRWAVIGGKRVRNDARSCV